jgi:hypothetical protein
MSCKAGYCNYSCLRFEEVGSFRGSKGEGSLVTSSLSFMAEVGFPDVKLRGEMGSGSSS